MHMVALMVRQTTPEARKLLAAELGEVGERLLKAAFEEVAADNYRNLVFGSAAELDNIEAMNIWLKRTAGVTMDDKHKRFIGNAINHFRSHFNARLEYMPGGNPNIPCTLTVVTRFRRNVHFMLKSIGQPQRTVREQSTLPMLRLV
jgi:hypothetical protein